MQEEEAAIPAGAGTPSRRDLRAGLKRYGLAASLLLVLAVGAWLLGPRLLLGPLVEVDVVACDDLVQTVVASGHVEAPHRVTIGSQVVGNVKSVPVREGQTVAAGQLLVALDSAEWKAAVEQADGAVLQAQARLRQLSEVQAPVAEQATRQARINFANARAQLRRTQDLARQGFFSQAALDDASKAAGIAGAQLAAATSQLESARPGGSDHAMATSALEQARASADMAHARLLYASILAPVAGTLIDRNVEPGDVVQPGKALMILSPAGSTQLVAQIDEKNLQFLAVGQAALASADAFAEHRFDAVLAYLNPRVDVQRGSVEVKLDVSEPPDYLRQDMTVSVDIRIASRANAILVPSDDVRDPDRAAPWVLKVEGRHARRQPIRLGIRSGSMSEVLEGLQPGEQVVPPREGRIADGSRLRVAVRRMAATAAP